MHEGIWNNLNYPTSGAETNTEIHVLFFTTQKREKGKGSNVQLKMFSH